jgi:hypothetical protein
MTTVWLWETGGPARSACGVTGHDGAARGVAEERMITTGADSATVEQATHLAGGGWMRSGYHRTGTGWTASRHGKRISWTRFYRPEAAAS